MSVRVTGLAIRLAIALLQVVAWLDRTLRPRRSFPRDIPQLLQALGWVEAGLRSGGALGADERVTALAAKQVKQNEAFRSTVAAVDASVEGPAGFRTIPLFAKFAPVPTSLREHAIYLLQENAAKECAVYRAVAGMPGFPVARAYQIGLHRLSGGYCLLLERLEAREVAESDGCPAELAELAVDSLAVVHAQSWEDEAISADVLKRTPPAVVDWLSRQLTGPDAALFGAMLRHAWRADATAPCTIQHGDPRVGNILFVGAPPAGAAGAGPSAQVAEARAILIDWQAARRGKGAFDVAYFLVLSLEPEVRRQHSYALLLRYHAALLRLGVRDYPLATLLEDARLAALLVLGFVTLPLMSAEASTTRDNQQGISALGTAWARRMVAVVEELDIEWVSSRCGVDTESLRAAFARSNDGAVRDFPLAAVDRAAARAAVAERGAGLFVEPLAGTVGSGPGAAGPLDP